MKELVTLFLRLGFFAFGGPAAHIAMLEREVVEKRQWLSKSDFLDLIGLTNLIPGPNSTEMVLHIGYLRAKTKGMLISGLAFILPAMLMVLGLAMLIDTYQDLSVLQTFITGMTPVVIALIASVFISLSKAQLNSKTNIILFLVAFGLSFLPIQEFVILFSLGLLMILLNKTQKTLVLEPLSLLTLFLIFLKIGAILYGSGYVLLSFLNTELIQTGYMTQAQILDAFKIGQLTPGPVFTTATAIGYFSHGILGAVLATIGIFLPSFIFVSLIHPFKDLLKNNLKFKSFLDGVKLASLALILKVVVDLVLPLNYLEILMVIGFLVVMVKTKINSTWLILGSGLLSLLISIL